MGRENMNTASSGPSPFVYGDGAPVDDEREAVPVEWLSAGAFVDFRLAPGEWRPGVTYDAEDLEGERHAAVAHVRASSRGQVTLFPLFGLLDNMAARGTRVVWTDGLLSAGRALVERARRASASPAKSPVAVSPARHGRARIRPPQAQVLPHVQGRCKHTGMMRANDACTHALGGEVPAGLDALRKATLAVSLHLHRHRDLLVGLARRHVGDLQLKSLAFAHARPM